MSEPIQLKRPEDIARAAARIRRKRREHFLVLALNSRNVIIGNRVVAVGSVDACPVDPREVFAFALSKRASAIVFVHNHPSGNPEPSTHDVNLTRQLCEGARLLGMKVLDHVVVTRDDFNSMLDRGELPRPPPKLVAAEGVV